MLRASGSLSLPVALPNIIGKGGGGGRELRVAKEETTAAAAGGLFLITNYEFITRKI